MRYSIFLIFLILPFSLLSQNLEIGYINSYMSNSPITRNSKLVVDKQKIESVYQELFDTTKRIDLQGKGTEQIVGSTKRDMDFFIISNASCERVIYDDFVTKKFTIQDQGAPKSWEISTESKMIQSFKVFKATTEFRGRSWTAWYTPDIPFPFGPWKLCGLPGLILEASDDSGVFNFSVSSVNLNSTSVIDRPDSKGFKSISLRDFTQLKDDFYTNTVKSIGKDDRSVIAEHTLNLRAGIERKFEWE